MVNWTFIARARADYSLSMRRAHLRVAASRTRHVTHIIYEILTVYDETFTPALTVGTPSSQSFQFIRHV